MFTNKDKKIANQKVQIARRDNLIDELSEKNEKLNEENTQVYLENKDLRFENDEVIGILHSIKKLISNYEINKTNPFTLIRDIKNELDASGKCI